jgi:hypothetical protein
LTSAPLDTAEDTAVLIACDELTPALMAESIDAVTV